MWTVTELSTLSNVTVVLWRHFPTPDNEAGRLQGQRDTDPGEAGRRWGELAAAQLIERHGTNLAIFSSPLRRAVATAELLAGALPEGSFEVDPRLTQRDYGIWQGRTLEEIAAEYPEELAIRDAGGDPRIEGWEHGTALGLRVAHAVIARTRHFQQQTDPPVVVLVSHGSAIRSGLRQLLGLPDTVQPFASLSHANWVEVTARGDIYQLAGYNVGPC